MKHEMNYELEELEKLLGGVEEKKLGRARNRSIMERLDRKTGLETSGRAKKQVGLTRKAWFAIAACLVLVLAAGFGTYSIAEAKEYNAALEFFEANGLSTEGLTRAEIKAVYRDITTEGFSFDKTNEVLARSNGGNGIWGWEIEHTEDPVTGDYESVIIERYYELKNAERYSCGISRDGKGRVEKLEGGKSVWCFDTDEMSYCGDAIPVSGGVVVSGGRDFKQDDRAYSLPAVMKLNDNGELLWIVKWGDDQDDLNSLEYDITAMVEEPDGGATAFSIKRHYLKHEFALCVTRIDADGNIVFNTENPTDNYGLTHAYAFEGGYLARILTPHTNAEGDTHFVPDTVMVFNADGTTADVYGFSEEGGEYYIGGMVMIGDKLYVSATVTDAAILDGIKAEVKENGRGGLTADELAPYINDLYTAVLLVCDGDTGMLTEFYQVKGAQASGVDVSDGRIDWSVNRIASMEINAVEGGFLFKTGTAEVWRYLFDKSGELIKCETTGKAVEITQ